MNGFRSCSTALLLVLTLAFAGVRAQQPEPSPTPKADEAQRLMLKPVMPPNRKPIKRRSVQQVIEPTPPIVTEGYRPTLVMRPPGPLPAPGQPPVRMNSCDAGGCNDTSGTRYNGGVGNTLIGPQGQLCTKGIVNAQCF